MRGVSVGRKKARLGFKWARLDFFLKTFFHRHHKAAALASVPFVLLVFAFIAQTNLFAATLTLTIPTDVDWDNAGATKSNTVKSGTDLVLSATNNQFVDTNWASNNYTSADYAINPTTETKLKAEVAQNFTSGSGLNTGSNDIRDVFDNGTYLFIATAGGLDVITKSTNTSKGYVSLASGFTAVYADVTNVYAGDGDGGVFKYAISNISGNTSVGSATYLSSTSPAIVNNNVNDLWGAVILNSTYLAVATAGGVTVINETAGTSKNSSETSSYSLARITTDNELYYYSSMAAKLQRKDGVASLGAGFTETVNYTTATTPAIVSNTITSLEASVNTSTALATANTVFVGTASGTSVIQEHSTQASGTVLNYDLQGTAGSSGWNSTNHKGVTNLDGTDDSLQVSDANSLDITGANATVEAMVKFPSAFDSSSYSKDFVVASKGENYKMYFDHNDGKLKFEYGTQTATGTTGARVLFTPDGTGFDAVHGLAVLNSVVYAGLGDATGQGDIIMFDGDSWSTSRDGTEEIIYSLTSLNGYLYAGQGTGTGDGDVLVCDPATSGSSTVCESGDWQISYNGPQEYIFKVKALGTSLYAAQGGNAGDGSLLVCEPSKSGGSTKCDSGDWWTTYTGSEEYLWDVESFNSTIYMTQGDTGGDGDVLTLNSHTVFDGTGGNDVIYDEAVLNSRLYIAQGYSTGEGDIWVCTPGTGGDTSLCDSIFDWSLSYDGNEEAIYSLRVLNGFLYAGQGNSTGDGKVLVCNPAGAGANTQMCDDQTEWSVSLSGAEKAPVGNFETAYSMEVIGSQLYVGFGATAGDGDIYTCDPAASGNTSLCESGDWWIFWDSAVEEYAWDFSTLASKVYASFGDTAAADGDVRIFNSYGGFDGDGDISYAGVTFNSNYYVGFGDDTGEAKVYMCAPASGGNISLCDHPKDWSLVYTATASTYETAVSLGVFNSRLYIGLGSSDNDADIIMCNPAGGGNASNCDNASDFTQVYSETGSRNSIYSMLAFNNHFYAGTWGGGSEGDILMCDPANAGTATECDNASDWELVQNTTYDVVRDFAVYNSKLYAGMGGSAGEGDVYVCTPGTAGDTEECDNTSDWAVSMDGAQEVIYSLEVYNSGLYVGQGSGTGDGDMFICTAITCGTTDWATAYDTTGFEELESLVASGSNLYLGFGYSGGDGDVYICNPAGGGNASNCDNALDYSLYFDGGQNGIYGLAVFNSNVYAHQGYEDNEGDIYILGGTNSGYDGAQERIGAIATFNGRMYAGQGYSADDGDIFMCNPAGGGNASDCDNASDWSTSLDISGKSSGQYELVNDLFEFSGKLYASYGSSWNDADIWVCDPATAGNASHCDDATDWTKYIDTGPDYAIAWRFVSFNSELYVGLEGQTDEGGDLMILDGSNTSYDPGATIERMQSLEVFNSKLYATAGYSAGDNDIFICSPATAGDANKCDNASDWATSYNGSQETFESLYALGGTLYAGQGSSWGDGDLYACNPAGGGVATDCDNASDWSVVVNQNGYAVFDMTSYNSKLIFGSSRGLNSDPIAPTVNILDGLLSRDVSTYESVYSFETFQNHLYTGFGYDNTDGDIDVCTPGADDQCDTGDWASSYSDAARDRVEDMIVYKNKFYAGFAGAYGDADIFVCDPTTSGTSDVCDTGDWTQAYEDSGVFSGVMMMAVFNNKLYAGVRGGATGGDIYVCAEGADNVCGTSEWTKIYDGSVDGVYEMTVYQGKLYAGLGDSIGEGDIIVCNPAGSGADATICDDASEWTTAYDSSDYYAAQGLDVYNGRLYASMGGTGGQGDVLMCTQGADNTCANSEWTVSTPANADYENAYDLQAYQGKLFVGLGSSTGDGSVYVCDPTLSGSATDCNASDWNLFMAGAQEYINALGEFNGELYAGQGINAGDAEVYAFNTTRQLASTTTSWSANTWYHVAFSTNGTTGRLFVNGTQQASVTESGNLVASSNPLRVGYETGLNDANYYQGMIDELRIQDTAVYTVNFTPSSSQLSFSGTNGGLWHFNDGVGSTAADASSNANNLTVSGAKFVQPALAGSSSNVTGMLYGTSASKMWVVTNGASADDGAVTEVASINTVAPNQSDSWTESSSTPNMVDNDLTAIGGTVGATNVGDIVIGTAEGVTRFYPGVAASGSLVSTIKDFGTTNSTWGNITFNSTANSQTITVKVRSSNNSDMTGATDWASCTAISSATDMTANSCMTDGHRYMQYRIDLSTTSASQNPQVEDVTLNASLLSGTWTYDFDAGVTVGWGTVNFTTTEPSGTDVKFRFATSSDGVTYSSYSSYYSTSGSSLSGLTNARYVRIQAYLDSSTDDTSPTLDTFNITYDKNLSPVVSNVTVTPQSSGTTTVSYSASDGDNATVTVALAYSVDGGTTWQSASGTTGDVGTVSVTGTTATKTISWTLSSNFNNTFIDDTVKVRVSLDDGQALNNTASATSAVFDVDTKTPLAGSTPITINSAATTTNSRTVTLTLSASDDSSLQMAFSNDGTTYGTVVDANGAVTNSGTYETYTTAKAWVLTSGAEGTRTAYVKFRDAYGNTSVASSDTISLDTSANDIVTAVSVADASDSGLSRYSMALTWTPVSAATNADFGGYLIQRSTNTTTYSDRATLNTITDSGFLDTGLNASSTYYYRIVTKDTAGNSSSASSVVFGQPGVSDASGPDLSGEAPVVAATETTAVVAWATDESATSCAEYGATTTYGSIECQLDYELNHSVTIRGLAANTAYHYRVRSTDASGNESKGDDYTFTTSSSTDDVTPPSVTGDGPIVIPVDTYATITWVTNEVADSFVEFGAGTDYGTIQGDPTLITNHSIKVIGLTPLKVYYFRVRSTDTFGNLALGEQRSFITTAPPGADVPPIISNIGTQAAGVSSDQVIISWQTDNPSTSQVLYGTSPADLSLETTEDVLLNLSHFATLSNLSAGTTYYYQVRSVDTYGNETLSETQNFATEKAVTGDPEISGLQVTDVTLESAIVTWTTNRLSNSEMQYGVTADYGTTVNDQSTNFTTEHTVRLPNLTSGTTYHLRINATTDEDGTLASDDYVFTTLTLPVVSAVRVAAVDHLSATIAWTTNVSADSNVAYGKEISYGANQGKTDLSTAHEVKLAGLEPKTTYHYQVRSRDSFGNIATGPDATFTTTADTIAPQISEVKSEVSTGANSKMQAIISWKTDELATSQVEYAEGLLGGAGKYPLSSPIDESLNSTHTVILTDLKPNTTFHFRVVSKDAAANVNQSSDRTLLSPDATESVLEEVVGSLEDTFSWVKDLRHALGL